MEKKPIYYDGSGHGHFLSNSKSLKKQLMTNLEIRKNICGNPYVIDWNHVRQCVDKKLKVEG